MLRTLASIVFTVMMFVSVPPFSLVVVPARLFGAEVPYAMVVGWVRAMSWLLQLLCGLKFEVTGQENIPKRNSVVLLKHSSAYETMIQLLLFPRQTWVLKRQLMWAPFLGWGLAVMHPIAIDRRGGRSAVDQVIAQGRQRLDAGLWVMVFPEGTRVPADETRRYGISGTLLAQASGRLLVPVAHNAGDYWPRRGWRKHPGTIRFSIGPPVDPSGRDPREVTSEIQNWIQAEIGVIRGQRAQSPTGDSPH